jgi:hypothetical protein
MTNTIYASFPDVWTAERAAGALIDHGIRAQDISFIANESYSDANRSVVTPSDTAVVYNDATDVAAIKETNEAESAAKHGISTTTAADVAAGAAKGVGVGAGVGVLAAVASLFVPGIGWVLGGGALAAALIGAAATTAAGAAAGGMYGYLRDQGLPDAAITSYTSTLMEGGAIMAVNCPSNDIDQGTIQGILAKYEATNVNHYGTMPMQEAS